MRGTRMTLAVLALVAVVAPAAAAAAAQTPQPFPRGGAPQPTTSAPPRTPPPAPTPAAVAPPAVTAPLDPATPSESALGVPIYAGAQFIASYDAGRGQRYFLFGSAAGFSEVVAFYRTQLKEKGNLVFEDPPTHMFEVGRFNNDTMAFPPGVTVKDWTSAGSKGYPNPKTGAQPLRFPTVVMIVPAPQAPSAQP